MPPKGAVLSHQGAILKAGFPNILRMSRDKILNFGTQYT